MLKMNLELGGGKKKNHFKGREYRGKSSLVVFILNLDGEGVQIMEMEFQRFNLYQSLFLHYCTLIRLIPPNLESIHNFGSLIPATNRY